MSSVVIEKGKEQVSKLLDLTTYGIGKKIFDRKINLGLDLQGGSYLLLEIDNQPIIEQKLQNTLLTLRKYFKDRNIKYQNLKI